MKQPLQQTPDETENARAANRAGFVATTDFAGGTIAPLCADTSVRRYFRVTKNGRTAVLMDARPPMEDTAAFAVMREKFDAIGLSVPVLYACDHAHGLVLMEDFGDERCFELLTQAKAAPETVYGLAVDALVHKFFADPAVALAESVAYSDAYWMFRVEQFLLHYMPHVEGYSVSPAAREDFLGLLRAALDGVHIFDPVLLHGDYGAQNMYYLPDRAGVRALGLIDFQDMTDARGNMMGSPAFDLVFLLQDVRLSLPDGLETEMKSRFCDKTAIKDKAGFDRAYATLGLAQAVKCLGLFARLGYGEGRTEYLRFLPYCWRNIRHNLACADLAPVKTWFEKNKIEEKGL